MSKTSKVLTIADYFIYKNNNSQRKDFTNKKLQKLLYYAQAWSLVLRDKKIFREDIEAWIHGPAIPCVYQEFKKFGFDAIQKKVSPDEFSRLTQEEKELLDTVWQIYGQYDAGYLEALTHSEEPWQKAREGSQPYESSSNKISTALMKEYYLQKHQESLR